MADNYDSPNFPIEHAEPSALHAMYEALHRQERHSQWHDDHPGEMNCPADLTSPNDYQDIERGEKFIAFGGATVAPGDSFVLRGGK